MVDSLDDDLGVEVDCALDATQREAIAAARRYLQVCPGSHYLGLAEYRALIDAGLDALAIEGQLLRQRTAVINQNRTVSGRGEN